jgi:Ca2+-binding RTX toxin-like protein
LIAGGHVRGEIKPIVSANNFRRIAVPSFNFVGDADADLGTSFFFLANAYIGGRGFSYEATALGDLELVSFWGTNEQPPGAFHGIRFALYNDANGNTFVTDIEGWSSDTDGERFLLSGTGFDLQLPVTHENYDSLEFQDVIRDTITHLFAGDDTFRIGGEVSVVWGDYFDLPVTSATIVLGNDLFRLGNEFLLGGISLSGGNTQIVVFGDAQGVDAGTTVIAGDDVIMGGSAEVPLLLYGDFQVVNPGSNVTFGNDRLYGGTVGDIIYGDGPDSSGPGGNDILEGYDGNDFLYGGGGNDVLNGGWNADALNGGDGVDTAIYTGPVAVTVDLVNTNLNANAAEGDSFVSIENLTGTNSEESDFLSGNDEANQILGRDGNDYLYGRGGHDRLDGGNGEDEMHGGLGNDTYIVSDSEDVIYEVAGEGTNDRVGAQVSFALDPGVNVERMSTTASGGIGTIDLTGNELVQEITGNAGNNRLDGRGGADTLIGLGGNDTLIVDNASDIVIEALNGGNDRVGASVSYTLAAGQHIERMSTTNSAGTNTIHLTGNEFAQELTGNDGNNWLTGSGDRDVLTSRGGNDTFDYNAFTDSGTSAATRDVITDFADTGGAQDRINVATLDANSTLGGNQAFVLDTDASFSTGEIRQTLVNGGTDLVVEFNADADAAADMSILLQGRTTLLDAADFVF